MTEGNDYRELLEAQIQRLTKRVLYLEDMIVNVPLNCDDRFHKQQLRRWQEQLREE